ncbi:MAG: isoprenylcysteine carboxylmethyltransferase family protein [Corynebacterium sp.]|uniref:methyltransferase family protein n=1 Tax=Corynebacterium sp. TaxID=1720 RepID=UPI0026E07934|nr:isoprenylcysteine carboxylmethyltransferase family protein [Corynebacterium sp.]MDO5668642.1 isoprenylcysteine carboxylmethyltransferase family protein [Corynebacterium sp.]
MRIPPAGLFALAAGAQIFLGRLSTSRFLPAAPLVAVSGGLGVVAVGQFARAGTTMDPVRLGRSSALVTDGVLGYTRNPMYLALAGALTAHAVARGSWWALVPVAGFVWAAGPQIAAEEAALRRRFGVEYEAYARRVPRWIRLR